MLCVTALFSFNTHCRNALFSSHVHNTHVQVTEHIVGVVTICSRAPDCLFSVTVCSTSSVFAFINVDRGREISSYLTILHHHNHHRHENSLSVFNTAHSNTHQFRISRSLYTFFLENYPNQTQRTLIDVRCSAKWTVFEFVPVPKLFIAIKKSIKEKIVISAKFELIKPSC